MSSGSNQTVKAAFLITGSTYVTYALGLLVGAFIARDLGPTVYGQYAYVVWLSGWLVLIANNGLNTSGIRFVAETLGRGSPESAGNVHGWLLRRQRASLICVLVVFVTAAAWIRPQDWQGHLPLFLIAIVVSVLGRAQYLFDISIAKGHRAFYVEAYSTLIVSLLNAAAIVVLALCHAPLAAYLAAFATTSAGLYICSAMMLRRAKISPGKGALDAALSAEISLHLRWTILLVTAASLGSKSIETFLLNAMVGPTAVGFFTIAVGLTRGGIDLLTVGLSTVLMPAMGRAFGEGGIAKVHGIFSDSLRLFLCFGLLLAGVGAYWSSAAILLLYGNQYAPVIPVLQVMMIIGGLTLGEAAIGSMLSTTGNQSIWAKTAVLSLGLSAIFALTFIPKFGLEGAVLSYACTRVIVFTVLVVASTRTLRIMLPLAPLGRLMLAGVIAAAVSLVPSLLLPGVAGDLIAGAIYLIAFGVLMIVLRAWSRSHLDLIASLLHRFPRVPQFIHGFIATWRDRYTGD